MIDWSKAVTAEQRSERDMQGSRAELKARRQALIDSITVAVGDLVFQGDETSQARMLRRAGTLSEDETADWIMADNSIAKVTAAQLMSAARAAVDEMGRIWIGDA